ncbi:BTB/POZ domain-containing protein At1g55760-like [Lotus japonicus]|uniref:BTB/POZ domain-containing protein At1g55760-like n=1 Tax=Lotus japonicus TaxID=34305 RepID=UPI0025899E5D|nr:BTB/POZ domain-containing protein At1g55760-like [Lotus japonicus]
MMNNDSSSSSSSSSSAYKVETTCRLAQWRVHNFASNTYRKSDPFKIAMWNWHLSVENNRVSYVKLYPELSKDNPLVASFIVRVLSSVGNSKALVHSEIKDKLLSNSEGYVWMIEVPLPKKFIIDIEFQDLKTTCPKDGALCSIWPRFLQQRSNTTANECLGRMLTENIHTDITIYANSFQERIRAHRAVLAARSPVFHGMFSHNLKESDLSIINISDMSFADCNALVNYLYGTIKDCEFLTHRLALLRAADKYDISDLREACHESLMEDIDASNVLERLQFASLYQLQNLKNSCMQYLVKFGKIFDIHDDFKAFLQSADRDLISEVFHEVLNELKGL